jgi:hypothetical protein
MLRQASLPTFSLFGLLAIRSLSEGLARDCHVASSATKISPNLTDNHLKITSQAALQIFTIVLQPSKTQLRAIYLSRALYH